MVTAEVSMNRSVSPLFLLATLATACGGSDEVDLSGAYSVDAHLTDPEACENAAPVEDSPGLSLRFTEQDLLGQTYFEWDWCADATGDSCEEFSGFSLYGEPIDGGWESRITLSSYGTSECTVGMIRSTATLEGDHLLIETRNHIGTFVTDTAGCQPELADERQGELACVQLEVIEATAL
jgi:hypothetical protein